VSKVHDFNPLDPDLMILVDGLNVVDFNFMVLVDGLDQWF